MRIFLFFLLIFLFGFLPLIQGQVQKDTLFFNNGSVVIGKMKKISLGVITFDPDDANDITVQFHKLKSIATGYRYYRLEMVGKEIYYARLTHSDKNGYVKLIGPVDSPTVWIQDIITLAPLGNSFFKKMNGTISVGYNYTRSSNLGRLNLDATIRYNTKLTETILTISTVGTLEDTTYSRDRELVSIQPNFYFKKNPSWFASTLGAYQRNLELGILSRFQEGAGIGNKFLLKNRTRAWGMTGLVINQETNTEGGGPKVLVDIPVQLQFNVFSFVKPKIDLGISQTLYFGLDQEGRIRNDGQTTLGYEIITNLKINLSFYNNYDSKPPTATGRTFDYGYDIAIGFTFN
jgi:hypothetical protein